MYKLSKFLVGASLFLAILTMPQKQQQSSNISDIDKVSLTNLMSPANMKALQALQASKSNYDALNEAGLATTMLSGGAQPGVLPLPPHALRQLQQEMAPPTISLPKKRPQQQPAAPTLKRAYNVSELPSAIIRNAFAQVETGGEANPDTAISKSGAVGKYQIMPSTAKWIAAQIGDTSYHPNKLKNPTYSARLNEWYTKYLSDMFDGDLSLVAAAYNAGPNAIKAAQSKSKDKSFNGIRRYLPEETRAYVPKFLNNIQGGLQERDRINKQYSSKR